MDPDKYLRLYLHSHVDPSAEGSAHAHTHVRRAQSAREQNTMPIFIAASCTGVPKLRKTSSVTSVTCVGHHL